MCWPPYCPESLFDGNSASIYVNDLKQVLIFNLPTVYHQAHVQISRQFQCDQKNGSDIFLASFMYKSMSLNAILIFGLMGQRQEMGKNFVF